MNLMPYVRCVGIGTRVNQKEDRLAYDQRLICILEGEGRVYLDGNEYQTRRGEAYFITQGRKYRVYCGNDQKIAVINFDTDYSYSHFCDPVLSVGVADFDESRIMHTPPIPFLDKVARFGEEEQAIIFELYSLYVRSDFEREARDFYLTSLFSYMLTKLSVGELAGGQTSIFAEIYKFVIDNACRQITVKEVASHFNYSTSFIEKSLRKHYSISFRQLVIDTRVKNALWLLENTSLSCGEIAARLGFASSQHFSATVMKKYGKRPSDLR